MARVIWVMLVVLVVAWAELAGAARPAAASRGMRMLQASATHADVVHLRTVVLLSFLGLAPGA